MDQNKKNVQKKEGAKKLLQKYKDQTKENENIHFEHYDWTYNDSSCCC